MRRTALLLGLVALAGCGGDDADGGGDARGYGEPAFDGTVTPTEREEAIRVANIKLAEEHPEDGQLQRDAVVVTEEDDTALVEGPATKTDAKWEFTLVREGDVPLRVQIWSRAS